MTWFSGAQLVEGLSHLHAHGVVHLDLKLDNCVRGRDDQWRMERRDHRS